MTAVVLGAMAAWSAWLLAGRPSPPVRMLLLGPPPAAEAPAAGPPPRRSWWPSPPGPQTRPGRAVPTRRPSDEVAVALALAGTADLMTVAVSAGLTAHEAVTVVARQGSGPVAAAFAEVVRQVGLGRSLIDALAAVPHALGPAAVPLTAALCAAVGAGTPLGPVLAREAAAQRDRARRAAEAAARRLPVLLLGPLVGLVLPAFVVLTLVPVAVATLDRAALVPSGADQLLPPPPLRAGPAPAATPRS